MTAERALVLWGGYPGHQPEEAVERFVPFLKNGGFDVVVANDLAAYADARLMSGLSLILQNWTKGDLTPDQFQGLSDAVRSGAGLVGWHGGLCDAFRHMPEYQFMTGGSGSLTRAEARLATPSILRQAPPRIRSWPDWAHSTSFPSSTTWQSTRRSRYSRQPRSAGGAEAPWINEAVIPAVWRRRWDHGRVFYMSWGHQASDFDVEPARVIAERGLLWAAGRGVAAESSTGSKQDA